METCWNKLDSNFVYSLLLSDCRSLFLRNKQTGECIAASERLVYTKPYALPYIVKMTKSCLDKDAQFRYLQSDILHNIAKNGTLLTSPNEEYRKRWVVYIGTSIDGRKNQKRKKHCLKQTPEGRLSFYNRRDACAEPISNGIVSSKCTSDKKPLLQFTFGKWNLIHTALYTHFSLLSKVSNRY